MLLTNSLNNPYKAVATAKTPGPWVRKPRAEEVCYSPTIMRMSHPSAGSSHHDDYYQ